MILVTDTETILSLCKLRLMNDDLNDAFNKHELIAMHFIETETASML